MQSNIQVLGSKQMRVSQSCPFKLKIALLFKVLENKKKFWQEIYLVFKFTYRYSYSYVGFISD